jgi:hypothetical protein
MIMAAMTITAIITAIGNINCPEENKFEVDGVEGVVCGLPKA